MKFGIVQGRLLPPVDDEVQAFPEQSWQKEFDLLEDAGVSYIEWIVTPKTVTSNPLLTYDLRSYPIKSICLDTIMDEEFCDRKFLDHAVVPFLESAIRNDIGLITVPLLEKSSILRFEAGDKFIEVFRDILFEFPDLKFTLETDLSEELLLEVLKKLNVDHVNQVNVTYDTGNVNAAGIAYSDYIKMIGHKIDNIHVKDRIRRSGQSVEYGAGELDFSEIFSLLKRYTVTKDMTLQLARGTKGDEMRLIKEYTRKVHEDWENAVV